MRLLEVIICLSNLRVNLPAIARLWKDMLDEDYHPQSKLLYEDKFYLYFLDELIGNYIYSLSHRPVH